MVDKKPPAAIEPVTNNWILAVLAPLRARLPRWPAVLPSAVGEPIKPLKIGLHNELLALLPAEDAPAGRELLKVTLGRYCNSRQYLAAVAAAQAMRHDMDGQPVEPVIDQHKMKPSWARAKRSKGRSMAAAPTEPEAGAAAAPAEPAAGTVNPPQEIVVVTVRVKAMKVAVVIPPEQLIPVAPGSEVVLRIKAGAVMATARLNPKAYRKALATIAEMGTDQVAVVVQGQMTTPGVIDAAGITVMPRKPKAETPPPTPSR